MNNLPEMTPEQLLRSVLEAGQPAYRADQLADWVYRRGVTDAALMTNLPKSFVERFVILDSRLVRRANSADGAVKLLLALHDGEHVETVLIPAEGRVTACLSTQAGCGMGCAFCASGLDGLRRNLTGGEIVQQLLHLRQAAGERLTHVVFMGMGEPLANYDATVFAIKAVVDPKRFGVSARHVTVSTVGLPKLIRRLADEDLPITLAVSLHAPNDPIRRKLIPAARGATIDSIIEAADYFFKKRGREVTLEYVLLEDVNDTNVCCEALARVAGRLRCNVNLLLYNPVEGLPYRRPAPEAAQAFADRLKRRGVNVQIRKSRGLDATAACGQLRRQNT